MKVFEFNTFTLDTSKVGLMKKAHSIEIEPQVFETLLLLIENRDRVVTKAELLEEIWHGRNVTDHVITRIIYELRKILDEKGDEGSHIRTVRGKGYQFVAEVIEKEAEKVSGVQSEMANKKSLFLGNNRWSFVLLFLLLILCGYLFVDKTFNQQNIHQVHSVQIQQNNYPIVAVLPIAVKTGDDELSMLVQSLIDYLTNQLALNLNMKVIHPEALLSMGQNLDDVWAIQKATRSDFIIQGFLETETDESIKLHLSLYKNNGEGELTPYSLGAFQFPYPKSAKELNSLYKQRKVTVRSIVQIIKPGVVVLSDGNTETEDAEAYRLAIAAHHLSRNDDCNDIKRAEQLLLKAVERDDEFAYAYYQLFANYFKRVWICGDSIEYHEKALAMAEIVERLAPNAYSPMALGRNSILVESNQVEKAYEFSKDADWNDPDAINHKNYGLRYAGFLKEASKHLDRILQLDPFYFSEKPIHQAPHTLLYQNRFSEHVSLLAEPGNSYHDYYRGLNLLLSGKALTATEILSGVVDKKSSDMFSQLSQALLHVIQSNNQAATEIIDTLVRKRIERKHSDGEMTYKLVQIYALADAHEQALNHLQISVNQGFFPVNYFLIDPALKSIQGSDQFLAIVQQARKRHQAFAERFGLESEALINFQ